MLDAIEVPYRLVVERQRERRPRGRAKPRDRKLPADAGASSSTTTSSPTPGWSPATCAPRSDRGGIVGVGGLRLRTVGRRGGLAAYFAGWWKEHYRRFEEGEQEPDFWGGFSGNLSAPREALLAVGRLRRGSRPLRGRRALLPARAGGPGDRLRPRCRRRAGPLEGLPGDRPRLRSRRSGSRSSLEEAPGADRLRAARRLTRRAVRGRPRSVGACSPCARRSGRFADHRPAAREASTGKPLPLPAALLLLAQLQAGARRPRDVAAAHPRAGDPDVPRHRRSRRAREPVRHPAAAIPSPARLAAIPTAPAARPRRVRPGPA